MGGSVREWARVCVAEQACGWGSCMGARDFCTVAIVWWWNLAYVALLL